MKKSVLVVGMLYLMSASILTNAGEYNITVDKVQIDTGDFVKEGIGYNGASPGPVCLLYTSSRPRDS